MDPRTLAFPDAEAFNRMGEDVCIAIGLLLLLTFGAAVLAIVVTRRNRE